MIHTAFATLNLFLKPPYETESSCFSECNCEENELCEKLSCQNLLHNLEFVFGYVMPHLICPSWDDTATDIKWWWEVESHAPIPIFLSSSWVLSKSVMFLGNRSPGCWPAARLQKTLDRGQHFVQWGVRSDGFQLAQAHKQVLRDLVLHLYCVSLLYRDSCQPHLYWKKKSIK